MDVPPVGHFTRPQRELYEALLEVNQECIRMTTVDTSVEHIFREMLRLLGEQLCRLGIISKGINAVDLQRVSH